MMRILLTGAAGFVGSHLAERLLRDGHEVIGVDNLSTGRLVNLESFRDHPRFRFHEADVSRELPGSVTEGPFDWILHFASPASPPKYDSRPIETMLVNGEGTRKLLDLCVEKKARFFFASTSEVYGDPLVHPQPESYWGNVNPIGVRSIYDEGKRYGEALCFAYHRSRGVGIRVIRIFNTYGPRMDPEDGRVVTNLMFQALKKQPLTLYGDATQTRSFQYVSDLIEGLVRFMGVDHTGPINLGNPREFTILEFAGKVRELLPGIEPIEFRPLPGDDPKQRKPDISRARELLGWEPKVPLEEGLKLTLGHFKTHELKGS
jgi:nucleoside-diphosphate-sugar epimerase